MENDGLSWEEARREVGRMTVFTTHTPVEAGHDRFDPALVEEILAPMAAKLGMSIWDLIDLGRVHRASRTSPFA